MVRRSNQRERFSVRYINPPKFLLIVSKVWTVNTMRYARFPTKSLFSLIDTPLESGPFLLLVIIFASYLFFTLITLVASLTATFIRATFFAFRLTATISNPSSSSWFSGNYATVKSLVFTNLFLICRNSLSSSILLGRSCLFLLFPRLARFFRFFLLLRFLPCRAFLLFFFLLFNLFFKIFIFLVVNQFLILTFFIFTFVLFS